MVEAVIVVLFLAMTFALLVGISGLYKAKLLAAHEARYRNTYNATNNCQIEGSSLANPVALPGEENTSKLDANIRRLVDVSRMLVFGGGLSRIGVRRDFAFGKPDQSGRARFSHGVSWKSTTACNEAPATLDPTALLKELGLQDLMAEIAESMTSVF